jgi:type II secretory pathway predicted ATPase ExeA
MSSLLTSESRRPFLSAPDPTRYFAASAIEEARTRVTRAIARSEGPALVVGASGTGKSLLLAVLGRQFASQRSVVQLLGAQLCTRRALLQSLLAELGQPFRGLDEGELRIALLSFIRGGQGQKPRRLLVLVDEADALPVRLLEELRQLTNVAAAGEQLTSLVLAGGAALEERFAEPQLDSFSQRLAARCYLAPMTREETFQYVRAQLFAVGLKVEEMFAADALAAVHAATGGVPRLVNQLGDQLTWMAEESGCRPLDATLVQQAWSELQQLPAPWNAEPRVAARAPDLGVIEFGELGELDDSASFSDADDALPASIPIASARGFLEQASSLDVLTQFEQAEKLIEEFDALESVIDAASPVAAETVQKVVAANPFEGAFAEEELIVDRYVACPAERFNFSMNASPFEPSSARREHARRQSSPSDRKPAGPLPAENAPSQVESTATDLVPPQPSAGASQKPGAQSANSATENAGELLLAGAEAKAVANATVDPEPRPATLPLKTEDARLASLTIGSRDLLLIEDEQKSQPEVVPGRQFRRLFSLLESNASRTALG